MLAGLLITIAAGAAPGLLLGLILIGATVAAAIAVRPAAVHLLFPVPAPLFLVAAVIAGLVHAHSSSKVALAVGLAQWIASGFIPMAVATAAAVLIAGLRWWAIARAGRAAPATSPVGPAARPRPPQAARASLPPALPDPGRDQPPPTRTFGPPV